MAWAVSVCLLLASLIVLLAVGWHASRLGDVPIASAREPAREDIWEGARPHYFHVTVAAGPTALGAWVGVLLPLPVPRQVRRFSRARARRRLALLIALSIGLGAALAFTPQAVVISRPMFVAVVLVSLTVAAGLAALLLTGTVEAGTDQALDGTVTAIPAPFDLKAGIDGGADIHTGVWRPGPQNIDASPSRTRNEVGG